MKEFICIAKCPELDEDNSKHCTATEEETKYGTPNNVDFCPCGKKPIWKRLEVNHEIN